MTTPPTGPAFADYHHDLTAIQPTKTRRDRREVTAPDAGAQPAPVIASAPQIVYLPAPAPIYYGDHGGRRHQGSDSPEHRKHERSSPSPPLVAIFYPLVGDWLLSLEQKDGAEKRDFISMRGKFAAESYLDMNIQDLSRIPRDSLGKRGFEFLMAEVSFLLKWLDVSIEELKHSHKSGRGEGKRPKHR